MSSSCSDSGCDEEMEISVGLCSANKIFEDLFAQSLPPLRESADARSPSSDTIRELFRFVIGRQESQDGLKTDAAIIDTPAGFPDGEEFIKAFRETVQLAAQQDEDTAYIISKGDFPSPAEGTVLVTKVDDDSPASCHCLMESLASFLEGNGSTRVNIRAGLKRSPFLIMIGDISEESVILDDIVPRGICSLCDTESISKSIVVVAATEAVFPFREVSVPGKGTVCERCKTTTGLLFCESGDEAADKTARTNAMKFIDFEIKSDIE